MASNTNLFLTIGRYVRRQGENFLTQSFAAIFNSSPAFRREFGELLKSRRLDGLKVDLRDFSAHTQQSSDLGSERIIVDAELLDSTGARRYVVEAKLEQRLTRRQLEKYSTYLKKIAFGSTLVLVTKFGIDPELLRLLPKKTVWLTWMELRDVCRYLQGSTVDRFLAKEFIEMLNENDIPSVDPISAGCWKKLGAFHSYATSTAKNNLNWDAIETVSRALRRMQVFAEAAWSELIEEKYRPYKIVRKGVPAPDDDFAAYSLLLVGYYRRSSSGSVSNRGIVLCLDCADLTLNVTVWWTLRKTHAEYGNPDEYSARKWPQKASRDLFRHPLHESLNKVLPDLRKALGRLRKTKYYKGK